MKFISKFYQILKKATKKKKNCEIVGKMTNVLFALKISFLNFEQKDDDEEEALMLFRK